MFLLAYREFFPPSSRTRLTVFASSLRGKGKLGLVIACGASSLVRPFQQQHGHKYARSVRNHNWQAARRRGEHGERSGGGHREEGGKGGRAQQALGMTEGHDGGGGVEAVVMVKCEQATIMLDWAGRKFKARTGTCQTD